MTVSSWLLHWQTGRRPFILAGTQTLLAFEGGHMQYRIS
jgi:hypothetical protein